MGGVDLRRTDVLQKCVDSVNSYFEMDQGAQFLSEVIIVDMKEHLLGSVEMGAREEKKVVKIEASTKFNEKHDGLCAVYLKSEEVWNNDKGAAFELNVRDPHQKSRPFGRTVVLLRSSLEQSHSCRFLALTDNTASSPFIRKQALKALLRKDILSWEEIQAEHS